MMASTRAHTFHREHCNSTHSFSSSSLSSDHGERVFVSPTSTRTRIHTRSTRPLSTMSFKHDEINSNCTSLQPTIKIVEVGPRDGLQNEPLPIVCVKDKLELIHRLRKAGCSNIEVGSFVSPKWIPQMSGSSEVLNGLREKEQKNQRQQQEQRQGKDQSDTKIRSKPRFSVLVPNLKGLEQALVDGRGIIDEIAIFSAASEEFTKRNINSTIDESVERFRVVVDRIREVQQDYNGNNDRPLLVRGYVSTVIACPYQGVIEPKQVARVVERMLDLGCYEVSLGDTTGFGTPLSTRQMLDEVMVSACVDIITQNFVY